MEPGALINHARHPQNNHKVIASSLAMEHQVFLLNQHAVVVTTVGTKAHAERPLSIGHALEKKLKILPDLLRITNHDPEDFFVYFTMRAHKYMAVRLDSLMVDGVDFHLEPWREGARSGCWTCGSSLRRSPCISGRWREPYRPSAMR
ncbi:Histidyl-tRNA synthetase [Hordeum vulgare]|nr:Histidyl-tRNA synthetase [Hordeum vulgare]